MPQPELSAEEVDPRDSLWLIGSHNWIPLRTLIGLRWVAIAGQVIALVVAARVLDVGIATGAASLAIGASILVNLVSAAISPPARRLAEQEAALFLVFDILQLGLLLALTGGLNNPFALLLLAPVSIAATTLEPRSTLSLGLLTLAVVTAIGPWHVPLMTSDGPLQLPRLYQWGFWAALAIGVAFLGAYAQRVTAETTAMADALYATRLALVRAQRLADLDGVVAATAHQLGTPLATIKLVSAEMLDEIGARPDLAGLRDDAALVHAQADRCRDILREMGQASRRDAYLDRAPVEAIVREAAHPHLSRGISVAFQSPSGPQPVALRRPEVVHGLRNLIQNGVDHARSRVEVRLEWGVDRVSVRIRDDGPGFEASLLARAGDPPLRVRSVPRGAEAMPRRGHEGMGLGLFIAKTLLERTGARLTFANDAGGGGAVTVAWPRDRLEEPET